MQRSQSLLILGVAVFLGLIAVFLANTYLAGREKKPVAAIPGGTVKVAVARVPLDYGTPVTPQNVRMVDWPASSVPQGAFMSVSELTPMGKTHVALRPIMVNEPVLRSKLSGEGGRASISAVLKPDMRAAAVRVNDVAGVAGFVLPGDAVDVLITRSIAGSEQTITDILLQNVRVIAIDQDAKDTTDKPNVGRTATLEVRQVDAQKLALGERVGSLSLVLRNVADQTEGVAQTVGIEDLREGGYAMRGWSGGGAPAAAPAVQQVSYVPRSMRPAAPKGPSVQIVRGVESKSYEVGRYVGF